MASAKLFKLFHGNGMKEKYNNRTFENCSIENSNSEEL